MPIRLTHNLAIESTRDESARQGFATGMREYVLGQLAGHMQTVYQKRVLPSFVRSTGSYPKDGQAVHKLMKPDLLFKYYSAIRNATQKLVWHSVLPGIERASGHLANQVAQYNSEDQTLHLNRSIEIPKYISDIDVHLMPGCYHSERFSGDVSQGALYDNGLSVFLMGYLGPEMDDTGRSVATFINSRFPKFKPTQMIDIGATIGFNTLPWLELWPELTIHAIDPSAPNVRYGHARCKSMGRVINYHQMDGTELKFEDNSVDIVWSAMVLHELPYLEIQKILAESYRVLKPGGLMIHMELPPNKDVDCYEQFYLDWDSFYNKEPFYKSFRDLDLLSAVGEAGFRHEEFFTYVIPSIHNCGLESNNVAAGSDDPSLQGNVGKLQEGLKWFTFGAWKR